MYAVAQTYLFIQYTMNNRNTFKSL